MRRRCFMAHTPSSAKRLVCCVDQLNPPPTAAILERPALVPKRRSRRNSTAALIGLDGHAARPPVSKANRSIIEGVVIALRRPGGRALQELRRVVTRLARGRALGRVAPERGFQFPQLR